MSVKDITTFVQDVGIPTAAFIILAAYLFMTARFNRQSQKEQNRILENSLTQHSKALTSLDEHLELINTKMDGLSELTFYPKGADAVFSMSAALSEMSQKWDTWAAEAKKHREEALGEVAKITQVEAALLSKIPSFSAQIEVEANQLKAELTAFTQVLKQTMEQTTHLRIEYEGWYRDIQKNLEQTLQEIQNYDRVAKLKLLEQTVGSYTATALVTGFQATISTTVVPPIHDPATDSTRELFSPTTPGFVAGLGSEVG